ncbi:Wadjet anti-phage system protein JetD domain-containing protein [Jiangella anatolica]|uniref:DUF3322 and DUF2220 domain-containing protein n=1 Tax=Jiangella anatolica TaxID=2670374 RepID=A0A2W2B7Z6_9ACTN|nr:Wadjet anti-phage system protein JetD domain-containing protein [Jiangella anatolica]PZF81240.1 hypothetical protein C1I92_21885 [Jiangella anatolica]
MATWTTPADIASTVKRRWVDGSLLRAFAAKAHFPVIDVRIRGPRASDIGDDLAAVRDWITRLDAGRRNDLRYALEWTPIGGRHIGRNRIPTRAIISSFDQAWALLGVEAEARRFSSILALASPHATVTRWVLTHPHKALALAQEWPAMLAAYSWLVSHRDSGAYLREISAPGVDTKFIERHRAVLAAVLDVPGSAAGFLAGLGLGTKPDLVRVRFSPGLGLPDGLTELAARADEMANLPVTTRTTVVCENEITYLTVPVPADGVVIWGKGFEVDRVGRLRWLTDADVFYWGDIDTHGFAILSRLRAWLPQTTAFLMDRETLLSHRDRWVVENSPTRARLDRLTSEEAVLYEELVTDQHGDRIRLEQERVDWGWATGRLPFQPG